MKYAIPTWHCDSSSLGKLHVLSSVNFPSITSSVILFDAALVDFFDQKCRYYFILDHLSKSPIDTAEGPISQSN